MYGVLNRAMKFYESPFEETACDAVDQRFHVSTGRGIWESIFSGPIPRRASLF